MDRKPLLGNSQLNEDLGSKENSNSPFQMKQNITSMHIILHITPLERQFGLKQGQLK